MPAAAHDDREGSTLDEHLAAENAHDLPRTLATYTAAPVIEVNGAPIAAADWQRTRPRGPIVERRRHRADAAIISEQTRGGAAVCAIYTFESGRIARVQLWLAPTTARYESSRDIILRTPRHGDAVRFYRDVLGLATTLDEPHLVGFETGAFQLFVEAGARAHAPIFELYVAELETAVAELTAAGCEVIERDAAIPRCYVRDPYGFVFNLSPRSRAR